MGIVSFVMDWSDKAKVKQQLLDGLNMTRGPGRGLDIPRSTLSNTDIAEYLNPGEDAAGARARLRLAEKALEEIIKERRDLVVAKFKKHLTLYFRKDFKATISNDLEAQLERDGFLAEAGETLTVGVKPGGENS